MAAAEMTIHDAECSRSINYNTFVQNLKGKDNFPSILTLLFKEYSGTSSHVMINKYFEVN